MHFCKRQKVQLAVKITLDTLALLAIEAIPLIDGHDQRPARFKHETGNVRILVGNFSLGVKHQHNNIARLYGLQRLDDREFFYRLKDLAPATTDRSEERRVGKKWG